jgi:hypothetical protein
MSYAGPATIVLPDGTEVAVSCRLDKAVDARTRFGIWSGDARPTVRDESLWDGHGGTCTIRLPNGRAGQVIIATFDAATEAVTLTGSDEPPF